jgi:hypothetical protein
MFKLLVLLVLGAILFSLFSGLVYMYRDRGTGNRAVRALTLRVGLSVLLFVALLLAYRFGVIPGYAQ